MNETSPLELLTLHLTNRKSKGDKSNKLYQKFNREITWKIILNNGYQRDLAPLLYHIISKDNPYSKEIMISYETKQKLKTLYNQHLATNLIQFNELDKILNAFEKEGIDVIQLKGAELAKNYYPHPTLRPMGDIDLLVRKNDMKKAKECLVSQGYEFKRESTFIDEEVYKKRHFHFPFIKHTTITPIVVELHQDIAAISYAINNNILQFWENASPIDNSHTHILTIHKEFLLLHILWHTYLNLSNNLNMRLIWLLDIAYIIKRYPNDIDWFFIEKKAIEWGIQNQVYFCLYLITQLFSIVFDRKIMSSMAPSNHYIKLFNFIILNTENNIKNLKDPNGIYIILLNLISLQNISAKIKYLFGGYNSKTLLSKKERIRRRYGLSSEKAIFLFKMIYPIILIMRSFKWLYKIFGLKRHY